MRKSLVYMVIIPPSFSNGDSLTAPLKKYFRDLSLVYKVRGPYSLCIQQCIMGSVLSLGTV